MLDNHAIPPVHTVWSDRFSLQISWCSSSTWDPHTYWMLKSLEITFRGWIISLSFSYTPFHMVQTEIQTTDMLFTFGVVCVHVAASKEKKMKTKKNKLIRSSNHGCIQWEECTPASSAQHAFNDTIQKKKAQFTSPVLTVMITCSKSLVLKYYWGQIIVWFQHHTLLR